MRLQVNSFRMGVEHGEDGWCVAQGVDLPGAITQGRDLDEPAVMARDCIECLTDEKEFEIELILPPKLKTARVGRIRLIHGRGTKKATGGVGQPLQLTHGRMAMRGSEDGPTPPED